jgi:hypothetical protein
MNSSKNYIVQYIILDIHKFIYLASNSDIVTSFVEDVSFPEEGSPSVENILIKKPGSFGIGRLLSLFNITTTDVMFGLSSG